MARPVQTHDPVKDTRAFWEKIVEVGGLDLRRENERPGFDAAFEDAVCKALGDPDTTTIEAWLSRSDGTLEALLEAVLVAAAPWGRMMRDVLRMLEAARSAHGGESLPLDVRRSELSPDLVRTLEQLQEEVRTVEDVLGRGLGRDWGVVAAEQLRYQRTAEVALRSPDQFWFGRAPDFGPATPAFQAWFEEVLGRPEPVDLPSSPPTESTGVQTFDRARRSAAALFNSHRRVVTRLEGDYDYQAPSVPMGEGWGSRAVKDYADDFNAALLVWKLDRLRDLPSDDLEAIGFHLMARLDLAPVNDEEALKAEDFLKVLKLPIWGQRHELYSTWIATLITAAKHQACAWVLTDGKLDFSFRPTTIARLTDERIDATTVLWSERWSPLTAPVSAKRVNGVQPDFCLHAGEDDDSPAGLVVECKQYWTPDTRNFSEALIDYGRAHPQAHVLLASYGRVTRTTEQRLETRGYPVRAFGHVRPFGGGVKDFVEAVADATYETAKLARNLAGWAEVEARRAATEAEAVENSAWFAGWVSRAIAVVRLSWSDGGDVDLHALTEADDLDVNFNRKGAFEEAPFVALDRDMRSAPGQETLAFAAGHGRRLLAIHHHSGDRPREAVGVAILARGQEIGFTHVFVDNGERWWAVGWLEADQTFTPASADDQARLVARG